MSSLFGIGGGGNVGASGSFYPYSIGTSLRFDAVGYLTRNTGAAGNTTIYTTSVWVKRSNISSNQYIINAGPFNSANDFEGIIFKSDDTLRAQLTVGNSQIADYVTNAVFRDTGAWYHIVWQRNGQAYKIYVNGTEQTYSTSTFGSNPAGYMTANTEQLISGRLDHLQDFDGYLAEFNFVDGTALDATSFGEEVNGVWIPKEYTGSYGNEGFHLTFQGTGTATTTAGDTAQINIGDDQSGNGNNFAVSGLVASDVVPDSPTNNFATWNPLDNHNYNAPSEGNLRALTAGNNGTQNSTFAVSSGKCYFEVRNGTAGGGSLARMVGIAKEDTNITSTPYSNSDCYLYYSGDGTKYNGSSASYGDSWDADGDIIGVALDMDNGAIWFSKNGTWQNSATAAEIAAGTTTNAAFTGLSGTFVMMVSKTGGTSSNDPHHANFGQDSTFAGDETAGGNSDENGIGDFKYSVPSGFLALAASSLSEPTIGPNAAEQADDYFNTVLYTGDGTSSNAITGVGFQPDWVAIKNRSNARSGINYDVIRGVNSDLRWDSTAAEDTSVTNQLLSFDADGFTVGDKNNLNGNNETIVAWNWKAGGTAVSNTDGDITSSVSAAPDAGFSIVGYTGDGTSGTRTIGCGLTKKPDLVILKNRTEDSVSDSWFVYATPLGSSSPSPYLTLYNTDAVASSGVFVDTSFSDNSGNALFAVSGSYNGVNKSGTTYIAYCFHNSDICKVGSYVGNGNADGTFVYTGFRPAWVMTKRVDSTSNWLIIDVKRDIDNVAHNRLIANLSNTEATSVVATMDILSNGFKRRDTNTDVNASGGTYIYLAFAEAPFKYSLAR